MRDCPASGAEKEQEGGGILAAGALTEAERQKGMEEMCAKFSPWAPGFMWQRSEQVCF